MNIPFNKPFIVGKELYYISQAVLSGKLAGDGIYTKKCHSLMEQRFNALKVLLTHSCTASLEMAAILCGIQPGDEVILPSYTFVSTANAFYLRGARLVFTDIRPDTLNIDENRIEEAITPKTKAIVVVHYAGIGCEMDKIMEIGNKYNIPVIEDAAQGVDAKYKDKYLGTIGSIGTYSFHETKNFISGEGGAIVLNDSKYIERAEIIREKGTNRSKFFRGEVDKYTWVDIGSSYLPSEVVAAFLYAQLEHIDEITAKRKEIYGKYLDAFSPLKDKGLMALPHIPGHCTPNYHMFYLILPTSEIRDGLMDYLKSEGILAVFHYLPLHLSPIGRAMGCSEGMLPVTESVSPRLLRLPFYYGLTEEEQEFVINRVYKYFNLEF